MLSPGFSQYRFAQNVTLIIFKKNPLKISDGVFSHLLNLKKQQNFDSKIVYKLFEMLDEAMKDYLGGYLGLNNILTSYGNEKNFLQSLILLESLMNGICSAIAAVDLVTSLEKAAGVDNSDLTSIEKIMAWNYLSDPISKELEENLELVLSSLYFTFFLQNNLITKEEIKIYKKKYYYLNKLRRHKTSLYEAHEKRFVEKLTNYPALARLAHSTAYIDLIGLQKKIDAFFEWQVLTLEGYCDISEDLSKIIELQSELSGEYQIWKNLYEHALQIERNRFIQLAPFFLGIGGINSDNFLRLLKATLNYSSYGMLISGPTHVVSLIKNREGLFFQDPNGLQCKANFNSSEDELNKIFNAVVWSLFNGENHHGNPVVLFIQAFSLNLPGSNLKLNKGFDTSTYFLPEEKLNQYQLNFLKVGFQIFLHNDPLPMLQNYKYLAKKYPLILAEAIKTKTSIENIASFFTRNEQITHIYFQSVLATLFPSSRRSVPNEFKEIQLVISNIIFKYSIDNESQQKLKQTFLTILKKYADAHPLTYLEYYNQYYSNYLVTYPVFTGCEISTQNTSGSSQKRSSLAASINSQYSFFKTAEVFSDVSAKINESKKRKFNY